MSDRNDAPLGGSGGTFGDDPDGIHDLAPVYALDALDDAERARFEAHLATCAACRREVDEFRESAAHLGDAAAVPPPAEMKASVIARIATTPQDATPPEPGIDDGGEVVATASAPSRRRAAGRRWMVPVGIAAGLILVVSAAIVAFSGGSDDVTIADVRLADDVVVVTLEGDDAELVVSWSPDLGRVAVEADDVAAVPSDRVYELWAIVGETPVAAGSIEHDGGAVSAVFEVDETDVGAWGVTIEPAGGSDVPTPPILYFGEV